MIISGSRYGPHETVYIRTKLLYEDMNRVEYVYIPVERKYVAPLITCSICLEDIVSVEGDSMKTSCKHFFHHACIKIWFTRTRRCPICRSYQ